MQNSLKNTLLPSLLLILILIAGCFSYEPEIPTFDYANIPESKFEHYSNVDSTLQRFSTIKKTNDRLDSLFYCIELLINYDEEAALEYAKEANRLATEKGKTEARGLGAYYLALIRGRQQKYGEGIEEAIVDAEISKKLLSDAGNKERLIFTLNLLGNLHLRKSELDISQNYLQDALKLAKDPDIPRQEALLIKGEILHNLANVYIAADSTQEGILSVFEDSQKLYVQTNNNNSLSRLYLDIGTLYFNTNAYKKADSLFQKSLNYAIKLKDKNLLSIVYNSLGYNQLKIFKSLEKESILQSALAYFRKSLDYQKDNFYYTYQMIGLCYHYKHSRLPGNVADIDSAIVHYKLGMEEAQKEGLLSEVNKFVRNMSNLCDERFKLTGKNCSDLLGNKSMDFLNSVYGGINETIVANLGKANKNKNDFERQLLEASNNQRIANSRMMSGGILLLSAFVFILLLQRQQQKRLKAQMEALRAQINPHFISNSLNAIESLVNLDQKDAASKYIIHFSRLSRQILNGSREANTTLSEEIKMLEHFLALEQLRFRDKLNYSIEVEEDITPELLVLPSMILQPYVENAIWHGIKPKDGQGLLQIKVRKTGKELHCTIEDDGIGRSKAAELKAASVIKQKSVGMQINHERLQVAGKIKGSRIKIEDLFDPDGNPAGTRVLLRLPLKYKK